MRSQCVSRPAFVLSLFVLPVCPCRRHPRSGCRFRARVGYGLGGVPFFRSLVTALSRRARSSLVRERLRGSYSVGWSRERSGPPAMMSLRSCPQLPAGNWVPALGILEPTPRRLGFVTLLGVDADAEGMERAPRGARTGSEQPGVRRAGLILSATRGGRYTRVQIHGGWDGRFFHCTTNGWGAPQVRVLCVAVPEQPHGVPLSALSVWPSPPRPGDPPGGFSPVGSASPSRWLSDKSMREAVSACSAMLSRAAESPSP